MNINPRTWVSIGLHDYIQTHPEEGGKFTILHQQLLEEHDIQDRKNMVGHVTSSFMLLDATCTKALMIHHNFLRKWLFPGGHYEGDVFTAISATRELAEETGFDLNDLRLFGDRHLLLDIDSHVIPANPSKSEGEHYHHDFLYLGFTDTHFTPVPQLEEVSEVKWIDLKELLVSTDQRIERAAEKVLKLIRK